MKPARDSAVFSEDQRYRFELRRYLPTPERAVQGLPLLWVMLNPSTADASKDDPTIRKCRGFAMRWTKHRTVPTSEIIVCNLFAFRATKPRALWQHVRQDGPLARHHARNLEHIEAAARRSAIVVVAWGATVPAYAAPVVHAVCDALRAVHKRLYCIETTSKGHPRHPLMAPYNDAPAPWRPLDERR